MSSDLSPPGGEFSVSSDAALDVVLAFSVPAEVDGVGVYVDVHEVVDNLALDVVLNTVYQEPTAHVHHLDEGQVSGEKKKKVKGLQSFKHQSVDEWQYCLPNERIDSELLETSRQ